MLTLDCNIDLIIEEKSWVRCSQHKVKRQEERERFRAEGRCLKKIVMLES